MIAHFLDIPFDFVVIAHRRQARGSNHHHLSSAADFMTSGFQISFHDNLGLLCDVVGMEILEPADRLCRAAAGHIGVIGDVFCNLETGVVGHVVLEDIQDEFFLDGLTHRINVEGTETAILLLRSEHFQCGSFRRSGKGKKGEVLVPAVRHHLMEELVLRVKFLLCFSFHLGILPQGFLRISESRLELHSRKPRLRRMGLVHDDGIVSPLDVIHFLENDREFLQSGHNDANASVDGVPQIAAFLVFTDGFHCSQGMIETRNGLLQLRIQHPSIRYHDYTGKYRSIFPVMKRGKTVGRPRDGIGLSRTCAVLDEIVVARTLFGNMGNELPHHIQLVIARKNQALF